MKPMGQVLAEAVAKALRAYRPEMDSEDDPEFSEVMLNDGDDPDRPQVWAYIDGTAVTITITEED